VRVWRIILAVVGIGFGTYGISQLLTYIPVQSLVLLALWLIGALIIHDGLLSPAVVGLGTVLRHYVPDRGRRYLQFGLIMAAIVTVIAIPMIYRANREPSGKALLLQDFTTNLTVLVAILGGATLVAYAIRVARDRSVASPPPPDEAHK
jgi:uncharacterized membrane protein